MCISWKHKMISDVIFSPSFQLKKLLRQSQRDHERETADHGVMVRELQTLVSTERNKSETIEHQVRH